MARNTEWSVPPMWTGQTVAILASGESMSPSVANAVHFSGCRSIVINTTFRLAPCADMLYAADSAWWQYHHPEALKFAGLKVTCTDNPYPAVLKLKMRGEQRDGLDTDPGYLRNGGNSGNQAIQIAVHAGAKRILLCGFDMKGGHWHGKHPRGLRDHGEDIFKRWLERFALLAPAVAAVDIVNCTPDSALKVWPYQPLDEALQERIAA